MSSKPKKVTYELHYPIEEVDGRELDQPITRLVFPRLKLKHYEKFEEFQEELGENRDVAAIRRFIENVCNLGDGVAGELDIEDIDGVQEKLVASMPKKLRDQINSKDGESEGEQPGKPATASSPPSEEPSGT